MFDSNGDKGPPRGVPSSVPVTTPLTMTPAFRYPLTSFSTRLSSTTLFILAIRRS